MELEPDSLAVLPAVRKMVRYEFLPYFFIRNLDIDRGWEAVRGIPECFYVVLRVNTDAGTGEFFSIG